MMKNVEYIQKLKNQINEEPLPGLEAQLEMAPLFRRGNFEIPDNVKISAVMILPFPKNEIWHTILIQRSSNNPNDQHSGQISLPGGKYEENDLSFEYCARRETFEEVGVPIEHIKTIGGLTPLYIPVSNFIVNPFVGMLDYEPILIPQPNEVNSILLPSVDFFLNDNNKKMTTLEIRGNTFKDVPYFDIDGKILWGATAMILQEFVQIHRNF